MLIGSFHHTLEQKGRLAIPASFRPALGDKPILTKGLESCLYLLPFNTWKQMTATLGDHPLVGRQERNLRRLLAHDSAEINFDSQGRILIPEPLKLAASLTKKVVVAGSIDWVEIWNTRLYAKHMENLDQNRAKLIEFSPPKP